MRWTLVVLFLALVSTSAEAQKRCVKGIPCGNTCISANKTCRIGSPASSSGSAQSVVSAAPRAQSQRAAYRFIVYERADGRLLLQAVPEDAHLAVFAESSILAFELSPELSREEAKQLADQMTSQITAVTYTSYGGSGRQR
jgi:hypothetical protein